MKIQKFIQDHKSEIVCSSIAVAVTAVSFTVIKNKALDGEVIKQIDVFQHNVTGAISALVYHTNGKIETIQLNSVV